MVKEKFQLNQVNSSLEVNFQLNYVNKIIGKQQNTIDFQNDELENVSSSRTFVYTKI